MKILYSIAICISLMALVSCNGSKALTKKAVKLEEAGLTDEAAINYYKAVYKKRTNVDAQIGLRNTGQLVYLKMLEEFTFLKTSDDLQSAVYKYLDAENYFNKVKAVGVTLTTPEYYVTDFENVKAKYLNGLYEQGTDLLEQEAYTDAEHIFKEIARFDPQYKDVGELGNIAYLEPHYKRGVAALDNLKFREAYGAFDKVIRRDDTYKDATALQAEALKEGTYTLAMLPLENGTSVAGMDAKMNAYIQNALLESNDPFLKIVDRENIGLILEEQKLSLSGVVDQQTAASVGELIGADALVTGTVLNYSTNTTRMQSNTKKGYEQYTVKRYDKEQDKNYTDTKYKSVNYKEFRQSSSALIGIQIKVISLQTGEILLSKIVERETKDEVNYAKYTGNGSKLYPAINGKVSTVRNNYNYLQEQLQARRNVKNPDQLSTELYGNVTGEIRSQVEYMLLDIIK